MIVGLYRSPSGNIDNFINSLNDYLEQLNNNEYYIIAGDININIQDQNISSDYINTMASHKFVSCINESTRVTNNTKSCIDHICIRNLDVLNTQAFILKCKIADHYATLLSSKIPLKHIEGKNNQLKDTYSSQNQ